MNRIRSTWATAKKAGQAPAVPGYGSEDQAHPAHQQEPDYAKYKKGDPDAWAETPKKPPYPEGNPPSVPGYDTEDQDHPAHRSPPRVEKLAALVEKRAQKALIVASHMLGAEATKEAVERKALDIMDWNDKALNDSLAHVGGGFLSMDAEIMDDGPMGCGHDDMGGMDDLDGEFDGGFDGDFGGEFDGGFDEGDLGDDFGGDFGGDPKMIFAAIRTLATEVSALKKRSNQNAYPGPTLGGPAKNEAALRAEAGATAKGEVHASVFDRMDRDLDGFVTASEFKGSKAVFAAIDVDADGVISKADYLAAFKAAADDDAEDEDEGEMASKKAGDDEDEDDVEVASKKADDAMLDLMASLTDDEIATLRAASGDGDDDDDEGEVASKKAAARLAKIRASKKAKKADDDDDEAEAEIAAKKAADRLAKIRAAKKADEDEDDGEDEGEVASKKAAARLAQLRKRMAGEMPEAFKENAQKKKDEAKGKDKDDDKDDDKLPDFIKDKKASDDEDEDDEDGADKEAGFFATGGDPMGLGGDPTGGLSMTAEDEAILNEIFAGEVTSSSLPGDVVAQMKPQPKRAADGHTLATGNMTRQASGGLDNLSDLWATAPDVSKVFG